jgi:hypothetical protein
MSSRLLLIELLGATALPLAALAAGWLRIRRDYFMLLLYFQALLYVFIGPILRLRRATHAPIREYEEVATMALLLLVLVFFAAYLAIARTRALQSPSVSRVIEARRPWMELVLFGLLAYTAVFWVIAIRGNLVYRRVGNPMVALQLQLPFLQFALYRTYIEGLLFIVMVVLVALVACGRQISVLGRLAGLATLTSAYVYWVINSRLGLAVALAVGLGVWTVFWRGRRGFWPRFLVGGAVVAALLLYSHATTQRIRLGFGKTATVTWRAFVPAIAVSPPGVAEGPQARTPTPVAAAGGLPASTPGPSPTPSEEVAVSAPDAVYKAFFFYTAEEMPLSVRLDGIDLIIRMKPQLERDGYAWGKAWEVPFALMYLPLSDPAKAREIKLSLNLAAKTYLMRKYTDITAADYVSSILTDAYGNFGKLGLVMVGLFLAGVCGFVAWTVARLPGPGWVIVGLFAISHIAFFEQEFVQALLLWPKKLPLLLAFLVANPFRIRTGPAEP